MLLVWIMVFHYISNKTALFFLCCVETVIIGFTSLYSFCLWYITCLFMLHSIISFLLVRLYFVLYLTTLWEWILWEMTCLYYILKIRELLYWFLLVSVIEVVTGVVICFGICGVSGVIDCSVFCGFVSGVCAPSVCGGVSLLFIVVVGLLQSHHCWVLNVTVVARCMIYLVFKMVFKKCFLVCWLLMI